ncbi:hypothetical protein ElyMa_002568200 [Elysia marginata]|uniref:Uncharacterized protein n=1 Tax=Elysia marginata TaxID=1093978 RepID=A0AAV4H111_9GAST|nr:hypothetical protein ElyMa_002568200 [Elysia marginata]
MGYSDLAPKAESSFSLLTPQHLSTSSTASSSDITALAAWKLVGAAPSRFIRELGLLTSSTCPMLRSQMVLGITSQPRQKSPSGRP